GEVCYDRLGCFNDGIPYSSTPERPLIALPWSPEKMNVRFLLYTRKNRNNYQVLLAFNYKSISSSNFRSFRKTRFIIHGFRNSGEDPWLLAMCKNLLLVEDVNCICVDWKGGSRTFYHQAVNNIRVVGAEVAYFVNILLRDFKYPPHKVHLIGYSLGAHAAGEAGKRQRGIGRITGLDPAGPYFENTSTEVRLDMSDAKLVDVIHTNAAPLIPNFGLGIRQWSGHLDFFPNGGAQMPGCPEINEISNQTLIQLFTGMVPFDACNHNCSIQYYTHSITNSRAYISYPCANYPTFLRGQCKTCPEAGCPRMGHYADTYPRVTSTCQVFYLNTS
ncbi:hypothetical protein GDO86_013698, partial [Hymenochirus boettgeri]